MNSTKPAPDLRAAFAGAMKYAGLGSGAVLAYFLLQMFTPEAIAEVLKSWGPGAGTAMVLGGLLIWRIDVRAGQGVAAVHEMTEAQRGFGASVQAQTVSMRDMSEAVNRLANKDNETLMRMEARIDETSDRTRRIVAWIEKEEERLNHGANR